MAFLRKGTYSVQELLTIGIFVIVVICIVIAASMSSGAVRASLPFVDLLPRIKACTESTFSIGCLKALLRW